MKRDDKRADILRMAYESRLEAKVPVSSEGVTLNNLVLSLHERVKQLEKEVRELKGARK